jgi:hypothetical protein
VVAGGCRDELFKANVVGRLGISTTDQLLEWVRGKNAVLEEKGDEHWMTEFRYVRGGWFLGGWRWVGS